MILPVDSDVDVVPVDLQRSVQLSLTSCQYTRLLVILKRQETDVFNVRT